MSALDCVIRLWDYKMGQGRVVKTYQGINILIPILIPPWVLVLLIFRPVASIDTTEAVNCLGKNLQLLFFCTTF